MSIRSLRGFTLLPILFLLLGAAWGEGTRTWEQSKFDELIKGTTHGVAIRSQGGLELAPAFKALNTTPSTYIWAIASDGAGNVYAAAGSPARVYRVTPDGKSTTIFEAQELQVQALVAGNHGELYAATAPDGKVYRIEPKAAKADGFQWSQRLDQKENIAATIADFLSFDGPAFLEVMIDTDAGVYPMVGPGATYAQMITGDYIASRDAGAALTAPTTPPVDMF